MSSSDENITELRSIEEETQDTTAGLSSQLAPAVASATAKPSSPRTTEFELERQPLLSHNHILPSASASHTQQAPEPPTHTNRNTDTDIESGESKGWFANMPGNLFFTLSTIYGATSVALGAFGAHGLKKRISDPGRIANWSTAAQYQLIHSVALLATSIALPQRAQRVPATLFLTGMTLFSGSIYLLVLDPARFKALGPVTPIGGLCLIGGWIGLGVVGRRFVR